jgi:hypothetical protein
MRIEDDYNIIFVCWHVYVLGASFFVWPWKSRVPHVTSWRHTGDIDRRVGAVSGMGGGIRKIKAIRWGAYSYYYSLVLNAHSCKFDMYKSSLRHIHDAVLSSIKMKGIRFFFFTYLCTSRYITRMIRRRNFKKCILRLLLALKNAYTLLRPIAKYIFIYCKNHKSDFMAQSVCCQLSLRKNDFDSRLGDMTFVVEKLTLR